MKNQPCHRPRLGGFAFLVLALIGFASATQPAFAECAATAGTNFTAHGWSYDEKNTRFQPDSAINRSNVGNLELAWAFRLDGGVSPHSFPLVTEDTVFIGNQAGQLMALEKDTGCLRWSTETHDEVRTAITHGPVETAEGTVEALFFSGRNGLIWALNAANGEVIWSVEAGDHSMTMLTGSPTYWGGKLYVPISSTEVIFAMLPWYGCCTFRGNVVALDANDGSEVWRSHVIPEQPEVTGTHHLFIQTKGPSGAPIWSAPTIDAARNQVLVGTGENYSSPATDTSDAIIAMDMDTGAIKWVQQYLAGDAFNVSCGSKGHGNCPEEDGPDLDFGAPPALSQMPDGTPMLFAGQKSGGVYALRPEDGSRVWDTSIGRGGMIGGVHWSVAVNVAEGLVFAPISDMALEFDRNQSGEASPGLFALDMETGERRWEATGLADCTGKDPCDIGLSAAITATDELVFTGWLDGTLAAHDAQTGETLWRYDSVRSYPAVNGGTTEGGTIDVHGPYVVGDMMFIQSGYEHQFVLGGNALLAFRLPTEEVEEVAAEDVAEESADE